MAVGEQLLQKCHRKFESSLLRTKSAPSPTNHDASEILTQAFVIEHSCAFQSCFRVQAGTPLQVDCVFLVIDITDKSEDSDFSVIIVSESSVDIVIQVRIE